MLHYNDIVLAVTIGFYYSEELGGTQEVIHEARKIEFAFLPTLELWWWRPGWARAESPESVEDKLD